jgi:hypothetical protein
MTASESSAGWCGGTTAGQEWVACELPPKPWQSQNQNMENLALVCVPWKRNTLAGIGKQARRASLQDTYGSLKGKS